MFLTPPPTAKISLPLATATAALSLNGLWLRWLSIGLYGGLALGNLLGQFYFFELFSHFQIQYRAVAVMLLVIDILVLLINKRWMRLWFLYLSLGLILLDQDTLRWWPGNGDQASPDVRGDVRVFHANVLFTRTNYEPTIALLRSQQPDLYVLQEMTPASIRLVTRQLRSEFPYWFACWSKGPCWVLAGSRSPFRVDRSLAEQDRIIALTTQVRGRALSLVTVHPRTPLLPSWFRERNAQLILAARKTRYQAIPTVLVGDFNISVFSPIYKDIFRSVEPPGQEYLKKQGVLLAARHTLTQPTWPRFFPPLMIPIDHVFTNGGFRPVHFRTLDNDGSDHRAVVADLAFSR